MKFVYKTETGHAHTYDTEDIFWITGDKRKITISEMDDDHLRNTIDYIRNRGNSPCSYNGNVYLELYAMKQEERYRIWKRYRTFKTSELTETTTTKKETKTMKHGDIKLENDLTKTLTQNIEIRVAHSKIVEIEVKQESKINAQNADSMAIKEIEKRKRERIVEMKDLEKEYQVQVKIIEANTKKTKTKPKK